MSKVLTVRDLRVRYTVSRGFVDVVHGVSLDINRGETTAIVGESGSGKTTLAMALCGLAPVYGGEVCFDGEQLKRDRRNRLSPDRKRVALMFQDPVGSLNPRMTIRKALAEPFRIHRTGSQDPDGEALRLLAMVGLGDDFADRYPHQLSGGQARRVGVARALALRPDILIADEPTAGLRPNGHHVPGPLHRAGQFTANFQPAAPSLHRGPAVGQSQSGSGRAIWPDRIARRRTQPAAKAFGVRIPYPLPPGTGAVPEFIPGLDHKHG